MYASTVPSTGKDQSAPLTTPGDAVADGSRNLYCRVRILAYLGSFLFIKHASSGEASSTFSRQQIIIDGGHIVGVWLPGRVPVLDARPNGNAEDSVDGSK